MLIRKIQRVGGSCGVVIPKPILEVLGWGEGTEVEVRVIGERMEISKAGGVR